MWVGAVAERMRKISYAGYRFPPEVIHQAIWLYLRFTLSFRDVEDFLAERGIAVSYETVRRWVNHLGPMIAAHLRKRRPKPHATWQALSTCQIRGAKGHRPRAILCCPDGLSPRAHRRSAEGSVGRSCR